eukprot:3396914-Prymnesium_polylepis.1
MNPDEKLLGFGRLRVLGSKPPCARMERDGPDQAYSRSAKATSSAKRRCSSGSDAQRAICPISISVPSAIARHLA